MLNREPYRRAEILIAGENFGRGSSREHAPWALLDFGIRSVIGPSFADIFFNNCFKNGILPVVLPQEQVEILMREAGEAKEPDLHRGPGKAGSPPPDRQRGLHLRGRSFRKHCLLNGLDDVGLMQKSRRIDDFEARQRGAQPWLYREVA